MSARACMRWCMRTCSAKSGICKRTPPWRRSSRPARLRLYGWVYNIETGSVDTFDAETGRFVPLTLGQPVHATPKPGLAYPVLQS